MLTIHMTFNMFIESSEVSLLNYHCIVLLVLVKTTRSKNALFLLCQKGCLSPAGI